VPGWTDDREAIDGLAAFVAGLRNVERVDIPPFHKLGAPKYEALGIPFPLADTPTPSADLVERVRAQFRDHGLRAYRVEGNRPRGVSPTGFTVSGSATRGRRRRPGGRARTG
jgi:pyruvate-formate lyase-activating enzyme